MVVKATAPRCSGNVGDRSVLNPTARISHQNRLILSCADDFHLHCTNKVCVCSNSQMSASKNRKFKKKKKKKTKGRVSRTFRPCPHGVGTRIVLKAFSVHVESSPVAVEHLPPPTEEKTWSQWWDYKHTQSRSLSWRTNGHITSSSFCRTNATRSAAAPLLLLSSLATAVASAFQNDVVVRRDSTAETFGDQMHLWCRLTCGGLLHINPI